ncbi:MAG: tyrosine-type recombinase/integrase [Planctomycetes bacterium]|nr:tyrosine-type recombinase/integrase [Planctomycetota bacterium]
MPTQVTPIRVLQHVRNDAALLASFILGRPATTARVYRNEIGLWQAFLNRPLVEARADDLRAYIAKCRESKLKPGTLRHKVAVIKSLYAFLYQEEQIPADPMVRVPTPPHPQGESSRCLDLKQVKAFFEQIPHHRVIGLRDRAMFLLAANCGLRLSEIARLSVGDVTDGPEDGWRVLRIHGKGDKVREVHARPEVWVHVVAYVSRRKDELLDRTPLFSSIHRGSSIKPQAADLRIPAPTIYKRFKAYCRRAELPTWASPHCMRHFFASEAHAKGAPAEAIRRALGHSSLNTTQRYLDRMERGVNQAFKAVRAI